MKPRKLRLKCLLGIDNELLHDPKVTELYLGTLAQDVHHEAAGAYTGDDPLLLWSNGTPILTNWPFFPPLDGPGRRTGHGRRAGRGRSGSGGRRLVPATAPRRHRDDVLRAWLPSPAAGRW